VILWYTVSVLYDILRALNFLSCNRMDPLSIFQLSAQLEGHPDNATPGSFRRGSRLCEAKLSSASTFQRCYLSFFDSQLSQFARCLSRSSGSAVSEKIDPMPLARDRRGGDPKGPQVRLPTIVYKSIGALAGK